MGLLGRLRGRRGEPALVAVDVAPDWREAEEWRDWEPPCNFVRGESRYQTALRAIAGPDRPGGWLVPVEVTLVREPDNPYDSNALRAEVGGSLVGYLAREIAEGLAPELDRAACRSYACCGLVRGGTLRTPVLGVHLWIERRCAPGPRLNAEGDPEDYEVGWPPWDGEGEADYAETPGPRTCPGCGRRAKVRILHASSGEQLHADSGERHRCRACGHTWKAARPA